MHRLLSILTLLLGGFSATAVAYAQPYDRVASLAENVSTVADEQGVRGKMVDLIRAMDRVTHTKTSIVVRPFARSLLETAAGKADFHLPFIQDGDAPAPPGLAYVSDVEIGRVPFVIYSRKSEPLDARALGPQRIVMVEAGHSALFPFPVTESNCIRCSMDMVLSGRADALVVSMEVGDALLQGQGPGYRGVHRALYKSYPVRALVPAGADTTATRRYLAEGVRKLKQAGAMERQMVPYADWQP